MIKEDVNELATRTGQGIAYYSGSKRRDVGSRRYYDWTSRFSK